MTVYRRWPKSPWYVYVYDRCIHVMHLDHVDPVVQPLGAEVTVPGVPGDDADDLRACMREIYADHTTDLDLPE